MAGVAGATFQQDILFGFGGGSPKISIAVLGGPVDRTHDCFRGARLTPLGIAAEPRGADGPETAQGTHIASLIFGQPCSSAEGVAPLCRGLIIPIFTEGRPTSSEPELARAIMLALDHGADIVLVSDGAWRRGRHPDPDLVEAITRCDQRNVLVVAAVGGTPLVARGTGKSVLWVGAIDAKGRTIDSTGNAGSHKDGLVAPGSSVRGAALEGGVAFRSGANFSAALVTGIAGLLLSSQIAQGQPPDPRAVGEVMLSTATPRIPSWLHDCPRALIGRDNIRAAAESLSAPAIHSRRSVAPSALDVWLGSRVGSLSALDSHAAFRPRG